MKEFNYFPTRRSFLKIAGLGAAALSLPEIGCKRSKKLEPEVEGLTDVVDAKLSEKPWVPVSDKKIRVGLVGYGYCKFSSAFGFQNHPNVEVVAVSDLFPDR